MKKIILAVLSAALLCGACNNGTKDSKGEDAPSKDAPKEAGAPAADAPKDAVKNDAPAENAKPAEANPAEANAPAEAPKAAVAFDAAQPGVVCNDRFCQCGSSACAKGETCQNGQCFCGAQPALDENYACKELNLATIPSPIPIMEKRYLCQSADGCACGETTCPQNATCNNGQCVCGNTPLAPENTGYACNLMSENQYDWVCRESSGCPCGSITAAVNMGCNGKNATCLGSPVPGRGLACRPKAYKEYKYHLACFKDECECYGKTLTNNEVCEPLVCPDGYTRSPKGCTCGGELYAEGYICVPARNQKMVNYCVDETGCTCGENECPYQAVCRKGECVDRASLDPIPEDENYTLGNGLLYCGSDEGCTCGKKKCPNGKFCIHGSCYKDPYFRKLGDKTLYYRLQVEEESIHNDLRDDLWTLMFIDENEPICQGDWTEIYQDVDGKRVDFCYDEQYRQMTVGEFLKNCGVGPQPENVGKLYCELSYVTGSLGHKLAETKLKVSGWKE